EDKPKGNLVTILSYALWQEHFGGDRSILGKTIDLSDNPFTVIGVMSPDFNFPNKSELWVPVGIRADESNWAQRGNHPGLRGIARLKPGVSLEQAKANMETIAINLEKQYPGSNTGSRVLIEPMLDRTVKGIRPALLILLGAVGFVLLIACANVANLLLARSASRQREIAIRIALGASRLRLIRQLMTESLLLALAGGLLGLFLAKWGVQLLIKVSPSTIPRATEISLDYRVLVFTMGVCILTGLLFGLMPALQFSKPDLNASLKESGRGSTGGLRTQRFRSAMIVSEMALSLVLLIGAGLLIRSFYHLLQVDPGFNQNFALSAQINLPQQRYKDDASQINFFKQVVERVKNLPGVKTAGIGSRVPLDGNDWQSSFWIEGRPDPGNGNNPSAEMNMVDPGYFRTVGIRLLKGREFTEQDNKESPFVVIIDETFAKKYWPNDDPLGKRLQFWSDKPKDWPTIVGIVNHINIDSLDAANDSPRVQMYVPFYHFGQSSMTLAVRANGNPANLTSAIREQVQAIDKDQPIYDVKTFLELRDESLAPQRLNMLLLGVFAALALVLSAVGIYGVMSYLVTQRTHEIGLRMALGAQLGDVLKLVVGHALVLALIGVAIGLPVAFFLTQLMKSLLSDIGARDPITFTIVPVVLIAIALLSSFIPARRASKVDPMIALRYE